MEKTCSEHGNFRTVIWRGEDVLPMNVWRGNIPPLDLGVENSCPDNCGICAKHEQETCCVLIEVTNRCDLECTCCFAGKSITDEPSSDTVKKWLAELAASGHSFLHFSGGEPTMRDDLPELVSCASNLGLKYLQLNTNGLRLADDPSYTEQLACAGLSFVFLQFDGTTDEIQLAMRGRRILEKKYKAIENCDRYNIGVALVSTVIPGVNDRDIGRLIAFGVERSPAVRGVHFQPVSYFGRYPEPPSDDARFTLPELLREIEHQTEGRVSADFFSPSCCDHPMCGFHCDFVVTADGLYPLSQRRGAKESACCRSPISAAEKNRRFVARRWKRNNSCCENTAPEIASLEGFLDRVNSHGFTITAMAFQDCCNIDIERLKRCSMHVYADGKIIPLCARYLTRL
jgi:uncharacterized radical SAM superfamily Fe-S cluster-containing enzyme